MAFNVDVNNRQLHPSEIKRINELAGGNAKRRAELEAAGCALVHCSAEFVQGSADYNAAKAKENSAKPADIALLSGQGGDLFVYDPRWYIPGSDASKDLATLGINKTTAIGRDVGKVTAAGTLILTAPLVEKVSPETANNMYGAATEALNAPAEGSTAVKASATVVLGVGLGTGQFVGDTLIGMATLSPTNPKAPEVYAQIGGRAVDGVITLASDPTGSASKAVDAVVSWGGEVKHNAEQIVMADNNGDRLLATTQTTDTAWVLGTTVAGGVGLVRGAAVKGAGLAPEASSVVLSEEVPVLSSANYGKPISGNGAMTMTVYEEEVASGQGLGTGSPWVTGVGDVRRGVVVDRGGANAVGTTTVTTFRVEGIPNQRIMISEAGEISLVPSNESVIWLNFGQEGRASSYLQTKIDKGLPGAELKSFDVDSAFVDKIRADAVPERFARQYPDRPIISRDPYPDQFGLPKAYFDNLINSITQGTGKRGR